MALYPQKVEVSDKLLTDLTRLYQNAYNEVLSELEGATAFGTANRRRILAQIQDILTKLQDQMDGVIDSSITAQYIQGANQVIKQLDAQDAPLTNMHNFNLIHREAIAALVDDTQRAIAQSMVGVYRSSQSLLSKAVRDQLTEKLAVGKVKGAALEEIKKSLVQQFEDNGLVGLTDKAGRQWTLDRYAEMLIRTKSVEARNRGLANRMAENGFDLVQVSAHGATDVCADWEGVILSLTGQTDGYPTVDEAESDGLFHPNCLHAINAVDPELAGMTHAYNPNIDTITGNDFVDQVDEKFKGAYKPPEQNVSPKTPAKR